MHFDSHRIDAEYFVSHFCLTSEKQAGLLITGDPKRPNQIDHRHLGMGLAKAGQILSAFELARRHLLKDTVKIAVARDVLPLVADIAGKQQEYFVCISLNGANEVIEKRVVTIGLLDKSPVHPREVFADVIADRAAAVIFAHNHPSGDLQPSEADLQMHERLTEAGRILGLRILDHVIVTKKGHYSFQEAGLIR